MLAANRLDGALGIALGGLHPATNALGFRLHLALLARELLLESALLGLEALLRIVLGVLQTLHLRGGLGVFVPQPLLFALQPRFRLGAHALDGGFRLCAQGDRFRLRLAHLRLELELAALGLGQRLARLLGIALELRLVLRDLSLRSGAAGCALGAGGHCLRGVGLRLAAQRGFELRVGDEQAPLYIGGTGRHRRALWRLTDHAACEHRGREAALGEQDGGGGAAAARVAVDDVRLRAVERLEAGANLTEGNVRAPRYAVYPMLVGEAHV